MGVHLLSAICPLRRDVAFAPLFSMLLSPSGRRSLPVSCLSNAVGFCTCAMSATGSVGLSHPPRQLARSLWPLVPCPLFCLCFACVLLLGGAFDFLFRRHIPAPFFLAHSSRTLFFAILCRPPVGPLLLRAALCLFYSSRLYFGCLRRALLCLPVSFCHPFFPLRPSRFPCLPPVVRFRAPAFPFLSPSFRPTWCFVSGSRPASPNSTLPPHSHFTLGDWLATRPSCALWPLCAGSRVPSCPTLRPPPTVMHHECTHSFTSPISCLFPSSVSFRAILLPPPRSLFHSLCIPPSVPKAILSASCLCPLLARFFALPIRTSTSRCHHLPLSCCHAVGSL